MSHAPNPWPLPARVVNMLGAASARRIPSAEELMTRARRATRLDDFGDRAFEQPLRLILADLADADLHFIGRITAVAELETLLVTRLEVLHELGAYPEVTELPIVRPIFVIGHPRTGTTLLHRLLAQDRTARWMSLGETFYLRPVRPSAASERQRRRRLTMLGLGVRLWNYLEPALAAIHELHPDAPEEEQPQLQRAFTCPLFCDWGNMRRYSAWLLDVDQSHWIGAYRHLRAELQLASLAGPGRWLLKSPAHSLGVEALLQVFPDACIVFTHRDYAEALPSTCSLSLTIRALHGRIDSTAALQVGAEVLRYADVSSARMERARQQVAPEQLIDVDYRALVRDPMTVISGIYARFGLVLTADTEARMGAFLANNRQHKHGPHRYHLSDFGLTEADADRLTATHAR